MPDINTTGVNNSLINDLSIANRPAEEAPSDKDVFMQLMLAQLKNQNPLEPQDGTEFLSQIAQFSTVEGVGNLNTTVTELSESLMSSSALQASTLVGKRVLISGDSGEHHVGSPLSGTIESEVPLDNVVMNIYSPSGALVAREPLGQLSQGSTPFSWQGTDEAGVPYPGGQYRVTVSGFNGGENVALETRVWNVVDSVQMSRDQGVLLNIGDSSSVTMSDVTAVR